MHREIDLAPFANLSSVLTYYARKFVSMQYTPCFLELASSQRYVSYGAFLEHFHPSHRALEQHASLLCIHVVALGGEHR